MEENVTNNLKPQEEEAVKSSSVPLGKTHESVSLDLFKDDRGTRRWPFGGIREFSC